MYLSANDTKKCLFKNISSCEFEIQPSTKNTRNTAMHIVMTFRRKHIRYLISDHQCSLPKFIDTLWFRPIENTPFYCLCFSKSGILWICIKTFFLINFEKQDNRVESIFLNTTNIFTFIQIFTDIFKYFVYATSIIIII